jgi:Family of unknown function (DUF6869)
MTQAIPRALVADALGMPVADLPPGDLPLERLATRFLDYLHAGDEIAPDHPDAWTFALFDDLTRDHPALGLAASCAVLAACESPEDVADIAAGPLEDLIANHGPTLIGEIEALAARAPRFAYALTGVWPQGKEGGLLWARVEAARRGAPGLDDGAPLPPADGLG